MAASRTASRASDGDDWVINGQKVWTTGAHYSDYGILLVRTNPDVPKHKGLTMFWIDMSDPAVEVPADPPDVRRLATSTRSTSPTSGSRTASASARSAMAGRSALVTLMNERLAVGGSAGPD